MVQSIKELYVSEALKAGIYRHYKGKHYQVVGVARHSETEETHVVYRALYGERGLWVRPLAMFCETIERDGRLLPRFAWVAAEEGDLESP